MHLMKKILTGSEGKTHEVFEGVGRLFLKKGVTHKDFQFLPIAPFSEDDVKKGGSGVAYEVNVRPLFQQEGHKCSVPLFRICRICLKNQFFLSKREVLRTIKPFTVCSRNEYSNFVLNFGTDINRSRCFKKYRF